MEISSAESEVLQLQLGGLAAAPSSSARSSTTAAEYFGNAGQLSQTLETSAQLTLGFGETGSISCRGAIPASRSVLPGSEEARQMSVTSGWQCAQWCQSSGPFGSFVKTCLASSHWGSSDEHVWIWNASATRHNRLLFQLMPLGQSTEDCECLLWPTPRTTDPNGAGMHGDGGIDLRTATKLWPTPQAHDAHQGNAQRVGRFGTKHGARNLNDEVMLWPTPTARDWKSTSASQETMERNARPLSEVAGQSGSGSLNPRFVEELMGLPIDHTALER